VDNELISRSEVASLPFNVADIARSVERIEAMLGGEDDGEEETEKD
jgi:hypothetical protein